MTTTSHQQHNTQPAPDSGRDAVSDLIAAMAAGTGVPSDLFTDDARLDATVPNWRFKTLGAGAVARELSNWYRHPGRIERLGSHEVAEGVALEINLTWNDGEVPHAAHQLHLIRIDDDRIATDTLFCGGRWPADLLAEMEAAGAG